MTRARPALAGLQISCEAQKDFDQLLGLTSLRLKCEFDEKTWEEELYAGSFVLGRHSALRLHFSNSDISQFHALIEFDTAKHQWAAKDLNSSNGSFINGKKLRSDRRTFLKKGDVLDLVGVAAIQVLDVSKLDVKRNTVEDGLRWWCRTQQDELWSQTEAELVQDIKDIGWDELKGQWEDNRAAQAITA